MERIHRLSMNTSLKNARIFDDDAWDEDDCPKIKKEIKQEPDEYSTDTLQIDDKVQVTNLKQEPEDDDDSFEEGECDDTFQEHKVPNSFHDRPIKKEVLKATPLSPSHDHTMEEGELKDSICYIKQENANSSEDELAETFQASKSFKKIKVKCKTPPPPIITSKTPPPPKITLETDAPVDRMFDESPYNKEMFKTLKIKDETPVKTEIDDQQAGYSRNILKSAKRTVFNRLSPYKKFENNLPEKRISAKSRLGPKVDEEDEDEDSHSRPFKRSRQEMESDPATLARREKQIEYGKNTIGYENYIKMVPKSQRKKEDPKTPPKYGKYSRRGWEGLIKQWRIKLHRFDPAEDDAS